MTSNTTVKQTGWSDYRERQQAIDSWLAREDALAVAVDDGSVVSIGDLAHPAYGLPCAAREAMLREVFQRWTTTWEGVLQLRLELGDEPAEAIRTAQSRTAEVRTPEWRAIVRGADEPVVVELRERQRRRVLRATGLTVAAVDQAYARAERATSYVVPVALRVRRARRLRRTLLARRAV